MLLWVPRPGKVLALQRSEHAMSDRIGEIQRKTRETEISLRLNLDGTGEAAVDTGIGFFDHMLSHLAKHGLFDITLKARGDLDVDFHHLVEDTGIVLGQAFGRALGDKAGLVRYGSAIVPMDECLVLAAVDLSGRPFCRVEVEVRPDKVGEFDTELLTEFMRALAHNGGMNLHLRMLSGGNAHHVLEASFKALARALDQATRIDDRRTGIPSTKGVL